jgi:hypothetical protein
MSYQPKKAVRFSLEEEVGDVDWKDWKENDGGK